MKKLISVLVCVVVCLALAVPAFAMTEAKPVLGDVNGIEGINAEDARLALRLALEIDDYKVVIDTYPTTAYDPMAAADVDGDGEVTAYDSRLILRYAIGETSSFPGADKLDPEAPPVADDRDINFWSLMDGWRGVFDAEAFRNFFNN